MVTEHCEAGASAQGPYVDHKIPQYGQPPGEGLCERTALVLWKVKTLNRESNTR
jgi:hypothetical protein